MLSILLLCFLTITLSKNNIPELLDEAINTNEIYTGPSTKSNTKKLQRRLSDLSLNGKQALLDEHNYYRGITARGETPGHPAAKNMNQLFWDDALYEVAKGYAEKCIWGHNGNRGSDLQSNSHLASFTVNGAVGENLYAISSNVNEQQLLNGIFLWYDEYKYFNFESQSCQNGKVCGHYTQLVWDKTRYVGCAYHYCPNGIQNLGWSHGTILVCNYYFAGNYPREEYQVANNNGEICSNCDADRNKCNDGLCSGCMNPDFPSQTSTPSGCDDGLDRTVNTGSPTQTTLSPIPTPQPTPNPEPPITAYNFNGNWNGQWNVVDAAYGEGKHPLYRKDNSNYYIYWNLYYSAWVLTLQSYINENTAPTMYSYCQLNSYDNIDKCTPNMWQSYPSGYFTRPNTQTTTTTTTTTTRQPTKRPTQRPTQRPTPRPTSQSVSTTRGPTIRPTSTTTSTTTTTTKQPTPSPVEPSNNGPCCVSTDPNNRSWVRKCENTWSNGGTDQSGCLSALTSRGGNKCSWVC